LKANGLFLVRKIAEILWLAPFSLEPTNQGFREAQKNRVWEPHAAHEASAP
jgi:hypothetical protein